MSNRFVVDLGDLKLDDAASRRISNAIQSAVFTELARLDSVTAEPFAVFDPVRIKNPEWYGIWIRRLMDLNAIPQMKDEVAEIARFAGRR